MAPRDQYDPETGELLERVGLAAWQKLLAVLSLALGGAGVAMGGASTAPPVDTAVAVSNPAGGTQTGTQTPSGAMMTAQEFAPAGGSAGAEGQTLIGEVGPGEPVEEPSFWAPLFAKGGLSFFLAFCIGYALRAAVKVTMIGVGLIALATFGLQKAGIIGEIDWARAQGFWGDLTSNLGEQFASLKTFVAGSLPSAASGGVGLFAGFRRQ